MDNNLPLIAKRLWDVVLAALFMLRKGISKTKLMLDLNMTMKRRKITWKAIAKLNFHHHHQYSSFSAPREYEFSCSNSPAFATRHRHNFFTCAHPLSTPDGYDNLPALNAFTTALDKRGYIPSSPALPGLGWSPEARQLRITDSPFPLSDGEGDGEIDKAAEEFIQKFYKQLKQQN